MDGWVLEWMNRTEGRKINIYLWKLYRNCRYFYNRKLQIIYLFFSSRTLPLFSHSWCVSLSMLPSLFFLLTLYANFVSIFAPFIFNFPSKKNFFNAIFLHSLLPLRKLFVVFFGHTQLKLSWAQRTESEKTLNFIKHGNRKGLNVMMMVAEEKRKS